MCKTAWVGGYNTTVEKLWWVLTYMACEGSSGLGSVVFPGERGRGREGERGRRGREKKRKLSKMWSIF